MAVHFKFKSAREFDKLSIEGPFVPVSTLKDKIIESKNLGKAADFDLVLTNAQTGEEYADENFLVPKNTSIIVKRVPLTRPRAGLHHARKPESDGAGVAAVQNAESKAGGLSQVDEFGAELATQPVADEELKLQAAVIGTATDWQQQQSQQAAGRGGRGYGRGPFGGRGFGGRGGGYNAGFSRGPPPPGYVCHRCGIKGHWIQDCPTNGDPDLDNKRRALKPPVGIPKSMLATAEEGSYLLPSGEFATLRPDETEFAKHAARLMANRPTARAIPPENQCSLCGNLFRDAVMVPCCHESFCDQCIREELLKNGKCPSCGATHITNDDLLPNVALRKAIERFKSEQAAAPTTSSADDRGHRVAADVTVVQSAPKSPSPLSRAPEDLHTRNSSGAESSAHVSATETKETSGGEYRANGNEVALSGRAAGGVDVGSEAVKAPERARSPLYNPELQRPRFPGGPDKEMADAMVARAGDWADMNGGAGAAPYGGVAVNKARMKELQEQHRCHICGSADHLAPDCPEHPTPDFPPAHVARQFPGFPGQPGPYPGPDFHPQPGNGFFPGPQPFPRPFGGPPMGPDGMFFDGMNSRWGPNGPGRGIPPPFGGPEPFYPPGSGYDAFPRPRMPGPAGFLSREEFQRKQEEARRALESKKRSEREESSDGSEKSHKHKHKKNDKEEKKHKKSRKEGRYASQERSREGDDNPDTEAEAKPSRRREKDRDVVSPSRYDREVVTERGRSDVEKRRRDRSPEQEDSGRRSRHRGSSARAYPDDDHWTPNDDAAYKAVKNGEGGANSPQHGVFSRLRVAESDDAERRSRSGRSHRRDPSGDVHDGKGQKKGSGLYGRESARRRRDELPVEDDDRWIA